MQGKIIQAIIYLFIYCKQFKIQTIEHHENNHNVGQTAQSHPPQVPQIYYSQHMA